MEYPYMISNNKIPAIFEKIKSAEIPQRFTVDFLRRLGFSSTNDRAFIPLIKRLGFLTQDGAPTEYFNRLKDGGDFGVVLADRIRDLYSDLFALNVNINQAVDSEIKGAIGRVTGKDDATVVRYLNTFKSLLPLANFEKRDSLFPIETEKKDRNTEEEKKTKQPYIKQEMVDFHYNIQIHLPATTDINIYNAIFKSIKENLMEQ
ncbi:MAG: DUF5343 domain-containing protein [Candidatus Shapirobacteria bacterium]|nr:DUF5343 domain-containing protein [Candidatus Shapirobacteria bacterium]